MVPDAKVRLGMSVYFKLYWRVIPYGVLLIERFASNEEVVSGFVLWLMALSLSFFKSDGAAKEKPSQYVGLFACLEWMLLAAFFSFEWLPLLIVSTICLGEMIWILPRWHKVYLGVACIIFGGLIWGSFIKAYAINTALSIGLIFIFVFWLAWFMRDLEERKARAQLYYDQLRTSEIALKKAHEELQAYYETLEEVVVLRERNRISRDIHDHVGHALATTLIQLKAIAHRLEKKETTVDETTLLNMLVDFMREALTRTRQVVQDMVPKLMTYEQFRFDLAELCQRTQQITGMLVVLIMPENEMMLNEDQQTCLYMVVKEGLTNAAKHGQAKNVKVVLVANDTDTQLMISDDGIGADSIEPGFGIQGIQARLMVFGGTVNILTGVGKGVTLKVLLPRRTS